MFILIFSINGQSMVHLVEPILVEPIKYSVDLGLILNSGPVLSRLSLSPCFLSVYFLQNQIKAKNKIKINLIDKSLAINQ